MTLFPQSTKTSADGGTSGAKAFFTGAWRSNTRTNATDYKGFFLSCHLTGFRFGQTAEAKWKVVRADWCCEVDNVLAEYEASNYKDYRKKYQERIKAEKEEEKKEREEKQKAVENNKQEGKDDKGNDTFTNLTKQIDELKANHIKSMEQKEIDLQEILKKAREKNEAEMEKINKQIELKNEEITKLMDQHQKAINSGDKAAANKIMALVKSHQKDIADLSNQKKEIPNEESFKEYLKIDESKGFAFSFKNKRSWLFLSITLGSLIVIILLIVFIVKKVRTLFSS
jgi:hypothetical protein